MLKNMSNLLLIKQNVETHYIIIIEKTSRNKEDLSISWLLYSFNKIANFFRSATILEVSLVTFLGISPGSENYMEMGFHVR